MEARHTVTSTMRENRRCQEVFFFRKMKKNESGCRNTPHRSVFFRFVQRSLWTHTLKTKMQGKWTTRIANQDCICMPDFDAIQGNLHICNTDRTVGADVVLEYSHYSIAPPIVSLRAWVLRDSEITGTLRSELQHSPVLTARESIHGTNDVVLASVYVGEPTEVLVRKAHHRFVSSVLHVRSGGFMSGRTAS